MKQDKAQEAARDEKLVPTKDRAKIGSSNLKIDPIITQKEETYQVILNIIKDSSYYNAFLITVDVPEIYMQQFCFTITKVKKSSFYQFELDNKKCQIDVELIQEILGISPRVPNQEFTKIIICYFLSKHNSISKRQGSPYNTFEDDGGIGWLRFIRKGEEHQVYGKSIPDILVTDDIQNSEAFKTFIALSIGLIPPKKGGGKGSQGTKATVTPKKATTAPKKTLPKKKESKNKVSHKQSSITAYDSILQDPNEALKLGKSVSLTEAEITEEHRRVHETYKCLVTERL
ncbi:hypothetical protein Tco_1095263, partial [Tanacetum coccineum]